MKHTRLLSAFLAFLLFYSVSAQTQLREVKGYAGVSPLPQQMMQGERLSADFAAHAKVIKGKVDDKALKKYKNMVPKEAEGYYLSIKSGEIVIVGRDDAGLFYGEQTLQQLFESGEYLRETEIKDWPSVECRGTIEGFYGNPWSHQDRLRQFQFYGRNKMNTYVYGPKDDPYHRRHWREAYPEKEAALLRELVVEANRNHVQFVWAVHPGLDIQWNKQDSMAIVKKLESVYSLGVRTFAVFFDDIGGEGTRADKQANLMNYITDQFVRKHKDVQPLILCPTQYNKGWSHGDYLNTLGTKMYPEVRIMWTGNSVVDMIEKNDMEWINTQIGRKAFIWLNYPVNDYCQSRMLMGKTYGNGKDIAPMLSGFCSNPMEYAEASKVSLYSIADYTWNMSQYDEKASWDRSIQAVMPTSVDEFRLFCENNVDLGKTGHGLRREGESVEFAGMNDDTQRAGYFMKMHITADKLLADSVNNPEMLNEIKPWVQSMQMLAERGSMALDMEEALRVGDTIRFIGVYKAQQAVERAQKAITSRNFEGSIVKAKPMVSGYVITPWVNEKMASLIKEYKKHYTYGIEYFPVQNIADGEYFIKVNGKYLTDVDANADKTGDFPVFQAERDVINPQRQQWVIEQDVKTGRYKITNKQDGRYLNEVGAFWKDKSLNPYDAAWHSFLLTRQGGKWSIQNAGSAGKAYWNANDRRITTSNDENFIFEIEEIK